MLSTETTVQDFDGVLTDIGIRLEEQYLNFQVTEGKELKVTNITGDPALPSMEKPRALS